MKREPRNYAYWKNIIQDPEKAAEFMANGNDRQKKEIRKVFKYMESLGKLQQSDLFGEK